MKAFNIIWKVVAAIAAIIGIGYVIATYGNKIVAWTKKLFTKTEEQFCDDVCDCPNQDDCENCTCEDDCDACECENEKDIVEEADFEG